MSKEKPETFLLKLRSGIVLDGEIVRGGELVEVGEAEAKDLLRRGKADLATEDDAKKAEEPKGKGKK